MMTTNTALWDQLRQVPKDAQKPFTRAGGFKGTAIKPMWTYHRMTEVFGPCGTGWGIDAPCFDVHPVGDEILVYCTVRVWYTDQNHVLVGVGGDKVLAKQKSGMFSDDEAFKKAFTDAVTNALKTLGAGADIHMGVYDGKYVDRTAEQPAKPQADPEAYLTWALDQIAAMPDADAYATWWKGETQARRDHALTQTHVDALKEAARKRFAPEQKTNGGAYEIGSDRDPQAPPRQSISERATPGVAVVPISQVLGDDEVPF